jgi:hypothetical protein
MDSTYHGTIADYQRRRDVHSAQADMAERRAERLSLARIALFALVTAVAGLCWRRGDPLAAMWVLAIGIAAFMVLASVHRRARAAARDQNARRHACAVGIDRVRRAWNELPSTVALDVPATHPFARDLNLFGNASQASLAKLLGPTSAIAGQAVIAAWLLAEEPESIDVIRERQSAVAELAPRPDWRESLGVLGQRAGRNAATVEEFLVWAETPGSTVARHISWIARLLTAAALYAAVRVAVHREDWWLLAACCAANLFLTAVYSKLLLRDLRGAASSGGFSIVAAAAMFDHVVGRADFAAPALLNVQYRAHPKSGAVLRRLSQIATCGDLRFSPLGHAMLQALTLWDFHVVAALAQWRQAHGGVMRGRLVALGEIEAYAALATLAYDNPSWTYPRFDSGESTTINATGLAHPLLADPVRIGNDVQVGPRNTFLLITGSNMAGKSTLLRALGLNVILAQVGAPVCAAGLTLPRVRVRTSMHIEDALERGTSLFMAELLRIRGIVAAAREPGRPLLLYLGDEMLHGTNTEERRIALVAIIETLLRAGAVGAVATHLDGLLTNPALAAGARPIHFSEQYRETPEGPAMSFDYRVRPGLATTRNGLKLLALVGLTPSVTS